MRTTIELAESIISSEIKDIEVKENKDREQAKEDRNHELELKELESNERTQIEKLAVLVEREIELVKLEAQQSRIFI